MGFGGMPDFSGVKSSFESWGLGSLVAVASIADDSVSSVRLASENACFGVEVLRP